MYFKMKPEQLYQNLKDIAEKFSIKVSERSFRNMGLKVKSGFCKVRGESLFIIDKHILIHKKNRTLASYLSKMPHEDIYVLPAVREFIRNVDKIKR